MKYRIKFEKLENLMYISHLEIMKTFRTTIRRAELPVSFSQGFNPHIILAMGPPLAVGLISHGEYFDLDLKIKISEKEIVERLNSFSPKDLNFLKAVEIPDDIRSLSSLLDTAVYIFNFDFKNLSSLDQEKQMLEKFLDQEEIMIIRHRRKKSDRKIDLKKRIFSAEVLEKNIWRFAVVTGSRGNLRPEELHRALKQKYSNINEFSPLRVTREGVYVNEDGEYYPPYAERYIGR
ncbi:MAG: TIGR03936 family radical SAM-associated protein [Halanaerobium sp.]